MASPTPVAPRMPDRPVRPVASPVSRAQRLLDRVENLALAVEEDVDATTKEQYALSVRLMVAARLAGAGLKAARDRQPVLAGRLLALAAAHAGLVEAEIRSLHEPRLRRALRDAAGLVAA